MTKPRWGLFEPQHSVSDYGIQITIVEIFKTTKNERQNMSAHSYWPPLRVVVKSDIEGGELAVVTDMVVTGAMESVDNLHMEWHGVNGPGFIRTGEEAEMIDQLADAVSEVSLSPSTCLFPR